MVVPELRHRAVHFEVNNHYSTRTFEQSDSAVFLGADRIHGNAADPELPIRVRDLVPTETFRDMLEDPA